MAMSNPEIRPALGRVMIQEEKMKATCFQLTARTSKLHSATPIVAPVRHCVVDTGNASLDARSTVIAAPSSIEKPRVGETWVILLPNERMTW
jgi:hypothetical protein